MEASLAFATTPLALASLAIIAGIGILKLLVAGKNNSLNRLITHYGFAVVMVFGLVGNIVYLYGVYQTSETMIIGNVVDSEGNYLPNVAIDTGGHARGMTSNTGDFVLAIPASRVSDSYDVSATLAGYEKAVKTVQSSSRMFLRFELKPKNFEITDMVKISDDEVVAGHYLGLPVIYTAIQVDNVGNSTLSINNVSITLKAPSGSKRNLVQVNSVLTKNAPLGFLIPQVQVKSGEQIYWANGFVQYDNQMQQLSANAIQELQSVQQFRQFGPQVGRAYLSDQVNTALQEALSKNWFWESGATEVRFGFSANGSKYELVRQITLSQEQIEAMKQSREYYSAGYGIIFGAELVPVGSAQPGHKLTVHGV